MCVCVCVCVCESVCGVYILYAAIAMLWSIAHDVSILYRYGSTNPFPQGDVKRKTIENVEKYVSREARLPHMLDK